MDDVRKDHLDLESAPRGIVLDAELEVVLDDEMIAQVMQTFVHALLPGAIIAQDVGESFGRIDGFRARQHFSSN